jgi:hypothetical protein
VNSADRRDAVRRNRSFALRTKPSNAGHDLTKGWPATCSSLDARHLGDFTRWAYGVAVKAVLPWDKAAMASRTSSTGGPMPSLDNLNRRMMTKV